MSGEDAPRPYLEDLIVLEIKTNKQTHGLGVVLHVDLYKPKPKPKLPFHALVPVWAGLKSKTHSVLTLYVCERITTRRTHFWTHWGSY
jgi:hypothetical protein